jgi:hypothetical protein
MGIVSWYISEKGEMDHKYTIRLTNRERAGK